MSGDSRAFLLGLSTQKTFDDLRFAKGAFFLIVNIPQMLV